MTGDAASLLTVVASSPSSTLPRWMHGLYDLVKPEIGLLVKAAPPPRLHKQNAFNLPIILLKALKLRRLCRGTVHI